ncbi:BTAD domain-containing putative transcriptional regulator [uncultured Jatrophihabitans sp.]|uniref:ATP-binding protein n=1 Tax=uncultured Jatrophihabitans sp. TaxID=1610747 RepID=UPI0035C9F79C
MRVDVLGVVAVSGVDASGETVTIAGQSLGGRRARVTLVALALSDGPVSGDRLAAMIWGDAPPATWPVALRGVIRGLRTSTAAAGGGDQGLVATVPGGYRLAVGIEVDVTQASATVRRGDLLLAEGRDRAVVELVEPVTRLFGEQLLPGEGAGWLDPLRRAVDATALHAVELVVESAGRLGNHRLAISTARRAVAADPLDERTHRTMILALDRAGDRAGAVQAYDHCRSVLADQLGVDPSSETVEVYLASLREHTASSLARVPAETSSFLGREAELASLVASVADPGLVTVTGRGGVGKSRLAMHRMIVGEQFTAPPMWVSLATVTEDALVASSIALALGVALDTEDTAHAIAACLAPRGRVLLVLDGCEAVVDGAASLVAAVLAAAPLLTVLATSRLPLSVEGERVLSIDPLPLPPADPAGLRASSQVRLLEDRMREAGGSLVVDELSAPHLYALCSRSGGLPLALELIAAQLPAVPAGDLLDQLGQSAPGDREPLRAVALGSYLLLDTAEATVFRRLGVLDGSVGLPLVRQVVSDDTIPPVRVVRILRELAARGLVSVDRSGPRWRYQQDDDLHRFARELLAEHDEATGEQGNEERQTYARLAGAIRLRLPDDARAAPAAFVDEITDILGSIRSLFTAALTGRADLSRCQELAFRLHRYFAVTNVDEGRFWLTRLLGDRRSGPWTPYATYALGYLSYWSGDTDEAMRELEYAADLLNGAQDGFRARALIFLAGLLDDVDRGAEAIEHVRLAIKAAEPFDVDLQVSAAMGLGSVLAERVDPTAAQHARRAIDLCRQSGSNEQLTIALPTAAMICWQAGALDDARNFAAEALPLHTGTKRIAHVVLLSVAAGVRLADGDLDAAVEIGRRADQQAAELGVEREVPLIRAVLARSLLAQGDLVSAADSCADALRTARGMSVAFPAAVGLETAALILDAAGSAGDGALRSMLAAARAIRDRGNRPPPASLAPAIDDLRNRLDRLDRLDRLNRLNANAAPSPDTPHIERPNIDTRAAIDAALDLLVAIRPAGP